MRVDLQLIHRDAKEPLYGQLTSLLRGAIHSGVYQPGEQIEPWRAFMEKGDLSYPTVARAISDLAAEGLLTRRGGAGTFVAEQLPVVEQAVKKIGVFYYQLETRAFKQTFAGIQQECALHGIEPITVSTGLDGTGEVAAFEHFRQQGVDGVIAMPMTRPAMQKDLTNAVHRDENIVVLNLRVPQLPCDAITMNYEQAGYLLTQHFLKMHHKHIAVYGSDLIYPNRRNWEVFTGIKRAHLERGLPAPDTIPQYLMPIDLDEQSPVVADRLKTLLRPADEPAPTALICTTGRLGLLALREVRKLKLRCPADISVACIGEEWDAAQTDPPMTAINTPLERLGSQAVRQIVDHFNQPDRIPMHTVLDVGITLRQSTDQAPQAFDL